MALTAVLRLFSVSQDVIVQKSDWGLGLFITESAKEGDLIAGTAFIL